MNLQKTGRKSTKTKLQAFRSKPTQYRNSTQNHSETKAAQKKKTKTNEPKNTATVKTCLRRPKVLATKYT